MDTKQDSAFDFDKDEQVIVRDRSIKLVYSLVTVALET